MPRRKAPLEIPVHKWINGPESIGEIVMQMAEQIAYEAEQHRQAGDINKLALHAIDARRRQAVKQINSAFAHKLATETRLRNAGSHQQKQSSTRKNVRICYDALIEGGATVTAPAIESEWMRKKLGPCVTPQQIRRYLREIKAETP